MKKQVSVIFMMCGIVFATCLIVSNIIEQKLINIGPFNFGLFRIGSIEATAGLLIFPISYIINDIIAEIWGYQKARLIIWLGFLMNFIAILVFRMSIEVPGSENFTHQNEFEMVLGNSIRITFASFIAFLFGAFTNAYVMSKMKIMQKGRNFSLRAVVSTLFGEGIDSIIFFNIAFFGLISNFDLIKLIVSQILMKTTYEILVLPLTNFIVRKVKKIEATDTFDKNISYNPLKINNI